MGILDWILKGQPKETLDLKATVYRQEGNPDFLVEVHLSGSPTTLSIRQLVFRAEGGARLEQMDLDCSNPASGYTAVNLERPGDAYVLNLPLPNYYLDQFQDSTVLVFAVSASGHIFQTVVDHQALKASPSRAPAGSLLPAA